MDYYNTYKDLLRIDKTKSSQDYLMSNNKEIVAEQFNNALLTENALINDVEYLVMFKQGKKSEDKKIIFKPDTKIDIGSVVMIDTNTYLAIDFLGDGIYEIYPTATLKLCNYTLSLAGEVTKELVGYDEFGRPDYSETEGTPITKPCIIETTFYRADESQQPINLPEGKVRVTIPFTTHQDLVLGGEITLWDDQYKITGIDKSQMGLLILHAELVVNNT